MGFADGFYYGQGRFIVDTTGLVVDTVVRVKSMTDNTKVWNQTVATVGTPLIFDVPCKDYYKICLVEDVSDVPTETVAVYKTVDYGQTQWIDIYELYPVIFENGVFAPNTEAIDCPYSGSSYGFDSSRYEISNGNIILYWCNGNGTVGKYLTFDLSKYIGKNLYFKLNQNGDTATDITKGFAIGTNSKKVVFGDLTYNNNGWRYIYCIGISSSELPTSVNYDSDKYEWYTTSPISWGIQIKKIWIAD